jgi:hypothetical protein
MAPFVPLRYSLPLPTEVTDLASAASLDTLLDDVGIVSVTTSETETFVFELQSTIAVRNAIDLSVPAVPGVQLTLFAGIDTTQLNEFTVRGGWRRAGGVDVELTVPVELRLGIPGLRPAIVDADGPRPDPAKPNLVVQAEPRLTFSSTAGVSLEVPSGLNLPPVLLGSSGFALEIHGLTLRPDPFEMGIASATLHFPKSLHSLATQVQVTAATLKGAGFSGTVQWVPPAGGAVVPLPGDLAETLHLSVTGASITFTDSVLTAGVMTVDFNDLVVPIPGLDGTALIIAAGTGVNLTLTSSAEGVAFSLEGITAGLRVAPQILRPVDAGGNPDPSREAVELTLGQLDVGVGPDGKIFADLSALTFDLPRASIGDSGVIVEALGISAHLDDSNLPAGRAPGWRGVYIASASLTLPGEIGEKIGTISLTDAEIGGGGFTGVVADDWDPALSVDVSGMTFSLTHAEVEFRQNALIAGAIEGVVDMPFFDGPIGVTIGLSLNGGFTVELSAVQPAGTNFQGGLVTLTKEDLFEITLESIGFSVDADVFTARLSGSVHPLVGDMEWPTFRVQELSIDSEGHVRLAGGWLDLREQYVLSLGGFQLEIARIGFGSTEDGRRWIGFSGGLKLVDGITAGASVEGLRVAWDPESGDVSLTLSGIGVEFEVPGTVYFKGYVAMTEPAPGVTRFDGQITLDIIAINLQIEAQLVVGYDKVNDYAFFAIYIGVELPAGIPLGQTGLGLFGLAGLFALQMEPNRRPDPAQPELPWYGIQPGPSWYHAPPTVGVAELRKWGNVKGSLALGAGVTIGTVSDNGYLFAGKFLLGIIFPGPILFIEGRANLLKERASLRDEPMFRTLVVLDARAGTFLMGIDAQYAYDDSGELIEIGGGAEAFFDFNDLSAWHIYLGIDEPRERRIRAFIFEKLFEANAYFMLDAHRLKTGAWIGYSANWSFGPLRVVLEAWIEGRADLSFKPPYFSGSLWLHGKVEASVFGFGFSLGTDARISAEVFDPYHILAELSVSVNLPWPLPDFSADVKLEWGPAPDPPLLPVPLKEISIEHMKVTTTWPLPTTGATVLTLPDADGDGDGFFDGTAPAAPSDTALGPSDASPVVPLDARPRITFGRPVHDAALVGVNPSVPFPSSAPEAGWEWIGDPSRNEGPARLRTSLSAVTLEQWNGSRWEAVARKAETANASGVRDLYGSWAPVPQLPSGNPTDQTPAPTANVKLWLWSKSAYDFSRRTGGSWDDYIDRAYPNYPCIETPKDHEECIDFSELNDGDVPAAPWHAAAHPEIEISWRVPPAPVVRVEAGRTELCFPQGADVEVFIGSRVKQVRLSVQYEPRKETIVCADFRERHETDADENPRLEGRVRIEVQDRAGRPVAQTRVAAFPTLTGTVRGLDAGFRTIIDVPPSDFVVLDLTRRRDPPRVEAIGEGQTRIDRRAADGPVGSMQTIRLERTIGQPKIVQVRVSAPQDQAALHRVCYGTRARAVTALAYDRNGLGLGAFRDENGVIAVPGRDVVSVQLDADGDAFCLTRACVVIGLDQADRIQREEMVRHIIDELARWQADDEVLEPWSRYRVKLVTTLEVRDFPHDASFNTTRTIAQCAYFRTEGPPGLASYSVPIGHPQANAAAPAGPSDPPPFDSGVQDLERYVLQTVPPTVPAAGEKPPLPRPVYRAYDVGVRFNENYVDSMYRLAGRDLSLALYDSNNQPVRDHLGRLLTIENRWGRTATVDLSASEERWIAHVNATTCADVDRTSIARDLTLGVDAHVLDPSTIYEGRLLPLLCREAFLDYAVGAQARGTGAKLTPARGAGWTVQDEGTDQGPSQWTVRETGTPPVRYVEQTTNVSAGASQRAAAFAGGTLLVRDADPRSGVPANDRPANWTDYRVNVYVRSLDDDLVGVGVRWTGRSGYLFTLDREKARRRLARIVDGTATILAEAAGGYDSNRDYLVQVEAVDDRIRVFVDGAPLFDVTDGQFDAGGVALYCGQNAGGQFRDVQVDDLRATAPIVYRFKFTTSDFTDFRHHVHSHQGLTFPATLPDLNGVAAALTQGVALAAASQAPTEAEARAYDELATKALGTAARQPVARVDVSRIEQGGAAIGLLVRTADPIDWTRTAIALSHAPSQAMTPAVPDGARLIRATFAATTAAQGNDESVTVLVDAGMNLAGWRIQCCSLPSAGAPALADGTVQFHADLTVDQPTETLTSTPVWQPAFSNLDDITTIDAPLGIGAAAWIAAAGVLRQNGNYRTFESLSGTPRRLGTYAVRTGADWRDVRIGARVRAGAAGAIGIVFAFQDLRNHYRFALDTPRNVRELTKRVNGVTQVLFSQPVSLLAGQPHQIAVEALAGRIRVTVDGAQIAEVFDADLSHGAAGFYTCDGPRAEFTQVVVDGLTRSLGPLTIVDHGDVRAASRWQIDGRLLVQDASLFTATPSLAARERSGSAAVAGNVAWTDVRVVCAIDSSGSGSSGVVVRWRDPDNHYRLLFTSGQRLLVRRLGGVSSVLWSDSTPFSGAEVVVEAIGNRLRAWIDDTPLFDVRDDGLASGSAGVLALDAGGGIWSAFEVRHAVPMWENWYQFDAAIGWRAAGRRFRVAAGRSADSTLIPGAGEEHLFQETAPAAFLARLCAPGADLRLVATGAEPAHTRRFLPDASFTADAAARVLRSADGTGLLVFITGGGPAGAALPAGEYRLQLTYRRDNSSVDAENTVLSQAGDTSDETASIDVPWSVSS